MLTGINRPVIPAQVTKLAKSINKMGIIRPVLVATISFITGKPVTYILDGQHLYHACMRENINIPYKEVTVKNIQDLVEHIALLNSSSKSWTLNDYIVAWQSVNKDYVKLNHYFTTYDLELGQVAELLHNGNLTSVSGGSPMSRVIKTGAFNISNEADAVKTMDYITDVLKVLPRMDRISNKFLIHCYVQFYKSKSKSEYNHKQVLDFITKNKSKFVTLTQDPEEIKKLFNKAL